MMCDLSLTCGAGEDTPTHPYKCDNFVFDNIQLNTDGLVIGVIPKNTIIFKSMFFSDEQYKKFQADASELARTLSQDNVENMYANGTSWFSNYEVAKKYASATWAKQYRLTKFRTIKQLKLFYLYSESNIKKLNGKIEADLLEQLAKFKDAQSKHQDQTLLDYLNLTIQDLRVRLDIIGITTGYGLTYSEQIEKLLKYGDFFTNDPSYHVKEQISNRIEKYWPKCDISNIFFTMSEGGNGNINNDVNVRNARNVRNAVALQFADLCTIGPRKHDLNRISWTTDMDKIMTSTITKYFNVDGYCAPTIPTLFHKDCKLDEEFGIAIPRDTVEVIGFDIVDGGNTRSKRLTKQAYKV